MKQTTPALVNLGTKLDFEQHLKTCYEDAVRFAWSLAGSKADGDDLLQDALLRAWRAFPKLRDPDQFKSWLLKIVSNAFKASRRSKLLKRFVSLEFAANAPGPAATPFEERDALRAALQRLPLAQREAVVMFEVLGMAQAEIARHQNASISAVKSRLTRGREKLRAAYRELTEPGVQNEPKPARSG